MTRKPKDNKKKKGVAKDKNYKPQNQTDRILSNVWRLKKGTKGRLNKLEDCSVPLMSELVIFVAKMNKFV